MTNAGECFCRALKKWIDRFPKIAVAGYVVMPDHVHICVEVKFYLEIGLGRAIASLKGYASDEFQCSLSSHHNQDRIGANGVDGRQNRDLNASEKQSFFQKGFNDRIAYSAEQWEKQKNYVIDNPRRYLMKKRYPMLYRMRWLITIDDCQYEASGNIHLLKNPDIRVVRFSRKYMAGEFERKKKEWEVCLRNCGVLVSPYIHPNERVIRDYALAKGGAVIRICENGFAQRFSPQGREFEYNALGQLLLIAPVNHNSQKEKLSYVKAQSLNMIAEKIAATNWLSGQGRIILLR